MSMLPQLLFTGIGIGSIYAMVSLGFVLLIRSANVVNFAQGEFSMLGAYLMLILLVSFGVPYLVALVVSVILMGAIGVVFGFITYWPLQDPRTDPGHHQHHRRGHPAGKSRSRDLRAEPAGDAGDVQRVGHPGRQHLHGLPSTSRSSSSPSSWWRCNT